MPSINRIRIINFSYNHDSRHIVDETFNFHGGENALLNLSNGGGKSVLVQLFLQVIVPMAKIQGRNIASFFRKKSQPTYIMIEWKLDGGGGYLLTGIGMTSAEAVEGEGTKPRVRYFNFTSKYSAANPWDIMNIPVATRHGGVLEIKPFREARKLLAEQERKNPYLLGYFPEDDRNGYARRLAEFGISQDEWRNVITRINDSENGLEDLFQKYRSSSQLLDDWIIKTVEKVMFKGRSQAGHLEEMLQGLVQEVIENERFIIEKQLFSGFLDRLQNLLGKLETLIKNLEEQKGLGAKLAALHLHLGQKIGELEEQKEANEQAIEEAQGEEQRLNLEERSHQYQICLEEYLIKAEELKAAEKSSQETEAKLEAAKWQQKLIEAARLAGEIRQINSELSGINERLALARAEYDKDERAQSLEYTIKTKLEELLDSLNAQLDQLLAQQREQCDRLEKGQEELRELESHRSRLEGDRGRLEERIRILSDQEKQLQKRLGRQWIRNLLGELDPGEMEQIESSLQQSCQHLLAEQEKRRLEKSELNGKQQDMDRQWKEIQAAQAENHRILRDYERERSEYQDKEKEIQGILERYGFDPSRIFDREGISLLFKSQINEIKKKEEDAVRSRNELSEALASIAQGHLHSSPEMAAALAELDIPFDTGESYLKNQTPEIRQAMLAANPILPYAFILPRGDMDKISEAGLNMVMRRIIPLMAYEDLNLMVENQGRMAWPLKEIALACLYEGRVFDNEKMPKLMAEMEEKRQAAAEQSVHYAEAHRIAVRDYDSYKAFDYSADYYYQVEKSIKAAKDRELELGQQLAAIEEAKAQAIARQDQLEQESRELALKLPPAQAALEAFREFMSREPDYQNSLNRLNQIKNEIAGLHEQKDALAKGLAQLQEAIARGKSRIAKDQGEKQRLEQKYVLYQDAPTAPVLEGSLEELEERLIALKGQHNQEIGQLEERQQQSIKELRRKQRNLDKLEVAEEEYADLGYDEREADEIRDQIASLESLLKRRQAELLSATRAEGVADEALKSALAEINRLGYEEPLPPQEIRGDFEGRRHRLHRRMRELEAGKEFLARQISRCLRTRENIEQAVDLKSMEAEKDLVMEEDFMAQASHWEREYRNLQNENGAHVNQIRNMYHDCKIDFRDKNSNLDNIFRSLDPLWDKAQTEYEDFFYLFERMSLQGEKLADLIAIYEAQLANLERNKQDMVEQSFLQGRRLMEEIDLISENSRVRLSGRSRPVQMLKIDLQLDSHDAARLRVAQYIDECIHRVREKSRQESRSDELRKTIARLMSSRELLNVYLGNAHIPVQVFKIDLNMQNSRLKIWEDAVRENSGGEKFVIFFSLLSALMAYTRVRSMEELGADPDTATRVLIMDNPFGPISSEHLLKPMFEIAKRHRTQLICLSDLKQNSILNCFNLIYMLKVRTSAIGGAEYLKFEEYVRDENALSRDERLEKAVYRVSEFSQTPLFG
jgi:DNA repair exonuclease SbcCD ATPase subunit